MGISILDTKSQDFTQNFNELLARGKMDIEKVTSIVGTIINEIKADKNAAIKEHIAKFDQWTPKGDADLKVDPALMNAIIRQESRFNLQAKSHMGALGLMQIMPETAKYVGKNNGYRANGYKLSIPEVNMKVGQDYLEYLFKGRHVNGDIVSMLIAYNAGPGNLQKWKKHMAGNADQLLFIEMLPVQETRDYVERVLSNYWIYRNRAGLDAPSLVALSSGKTPKFAHILDTGSYKIASN